MTDYSTTLRRLQEKRHRALALAASYSRIGNTRLADLVLNCGTFLEIAETEEGARIVAANFCKARLCPSCAWRRSLKIYAGTSAILDHIDRTRPGQVKYLFLTLTVRNIPLSDLGHAIDSMAEAYNRLRNNRAWKRRVLGAMRTLEVTLNEETKEAHPHYHFILAVDRQYATKSDETYWTHEDWQNAWKKSARLDYAPNVSIERVKGRRSGIAEVSKYMAKDSDYLKDGDAEFTDWAVRGLTDALHGRRLISYTGIMRDAQRDIGMEDPEDGALTDDLRGDIACVIRRYHWSAGLGCYVPGEGAQR